MFFAVCDPGASKTEGVRLSLISSKLAGTLGSLCNLFARYRLLRHKRNAT